ncbi:MAG: glycosyltransferase family 39 protein [Herpetosiphonaceae bacterium]|nr:glycosyltransferase family 39 protein [Herpetosiphonaceae bacterium]
MCLLFLVALVVRSYRLAANPLWFDELYSFQLGQLGFVAIIRNSGYESHPPLYYLIQWVAAGFGMLRTEWAWRWLSVLSGAATVPLIYALVATTASRLTAVLASLLMLLSPADIYFSQEGRPYALLVCITALVALLIWRLEQRPEDRRSWFVLAVCSVVGVWMSYSYVMVLAPVLLYLVARMRWQRYLLISIAVVLASSAPLIAIGPRTLHSILAGSAHATQLTLRDALEMIVGGDFLRYGLRPAHMWMPVVEGVLALAGLASVRRRANPTIAYHVMQLVLPLIGFFLIAMPLLHIFLPAFDWKQFLILLPAWIFLVAIGIESLQVVRFERFGQALALLLTALLIYGSSQNLHDYWTKSKSPEGLAALAVQHSLQPGDAVVSLHHSLDAALSFYAADADSFTKPTKTSSGLMFSTSLLVLLGEQSHLSHNASILAIRKHQRVWVLSNGTIDPMLQQQLTSNCTVISRQVFAPFAVVLLTNCR